jgi:hypothetical protein
MESKYADRVHFANLGAGISLFGALLEHVCTRSAHKERHKHIAVRIELPPVTRSVAGAIVHDALERRGVRFRAGIIDQAMPIGSRFDAADNRTFLNAIGRYETFGFQRCRRM